MNRTPLPFVLDDGGRAAAGYRGATGDCACRAAAIASGLPYQAVYERLAALSARERWGTRKRGRSHPRTGVHHATMRTLMEQLGFEWIPTMGIGTGCRVHLCEGELPVDGRLVVSLSKHYAAVIDGAVHDTFDPSRGGMRCVYGYWRRP